ncbi:DUF502 domain-containing protein [uncultured Aquitalea sp.]|uniref:DUF502 domain-containing protein n=1 Tax=uncultured Aquitalea sp. TaxID=540272 RepID=UPI0025DBEE2E|nr:DUF502 domain-containing protein [uncultured Aquitalea sp.]
MLTRGLRAVAATWVAGAVSLLPLMLTLALLAWLSGLVNQLVGPSSALGRGFTLFGSLFSLHPVLAWVLGWGALLLAIYCLGLAVQRGLKGRLKRWINTAIERIPLVGGLYAIAEKVVGLIDKQPEADIAAMSPVWCFFGGDGVAVLGLLANPQPLVLRGRPHLAVMVPMAPVPVGGGLLYVPAEWVEPAEIGIDRWTAVYVSMGMTPPEPDARPGQAIRQDPSVGR